MKSLLSAFAFLTIMPVPIRWLDAEQNYACCVKYFPLVGLVLGSLVALIGYAITLILPQLPAAVVIAGLMVAMSGALHLDGLADTADGFLSSRPRDAVLEIMKDSRIGTMGVAAILLLLLLKVSALSELLAQPALSGLLAVAVSVLAGRCTFVWSMRLNQYARKDGLGKSFWVRSWNLSLFSLMVLSLTAWLLLGYRGLIAVAASGFTVALVAIWCHRRIGGATGDTAGACCELTEACFLLSIVGANHAGGTA
ncbi:MAG: adenosylcobinamide-GDP ribazoletransferase [Pirellulales bacterium]|nr:adenosylcobinamide-GDP ribazoletransferase [Pirellulales bacterium]